MLSGEARSLLFNGSIDSDRFEGEASAVDNLRDIARSMGPWSRELLYDRGLHPPVARGRACNPPDQHHSREPICSLKQPTRCGYPEGQTDGPTTAARAAFGAR